MTAQSFLILFEPSLQADFVFHLILARLTGGNRKGGTHDPEYRSVP